MPYDLNYMYAPLPPRRPNLFGYGQEDMNAMARLIQGPTEEEKKRMWLERIHTSPYYRPRDPDASMIESNWNMMRRDLFPYLKMMGLAVGDYQD